MILKEIEWKSNKTKYDWEEIPQEELWEDGELSKIDVHFKIIDKVLYLGDWKLIRRTEK